MINVVTTQANVVEVGREMCESPVVKKVSFTGSTPVAKLLAGMAAKTLKKCVHDDFSVCLMLTSFVQGVD